MLSQSNHFHCIFWVKFTLISPALQPWDFFFSFCKGNAAESLRKLLSASESRKDHPSVLSACHMAVRWLERKSQHHSETWKGWADVPTLVSRKAGAPAWVVYFSRGKSLSKPRCPWESKPATCFSPDTLAELAPLVQTVPACRTDSLFLVACRGSGVHTVP